ncbi:methyltransferase type 11 [Nocardia seriolae]|uniref:Methyltransferase type 11 n=1 Tax=Nocardia seriolae TaxID=37332 RepID=A0ABC9YS45_9NOCA|nr:methyltransferase type 11 [Nocardia seriolae]GEM23635.1 methyltransferase type 11 [Nocardia seriolae NBRC 15557]BEK87778.1 class I SAM-dependent methyltransferase [Nocardia seriolae]BEK95342.1 class I SAM-dependent methyltransferase [Nocardia seriolae]GAM45975.1 methyltransferase type 11 [Nocardia seriolae]
MAESFGIDAARYDRTRPPYPAAMIEAVLAATPGRNLLDVGCGTGIEARRFRDAGCTVLGVEPDARMADFARATGIEVEIGMFEQWDPAGRSFDGVISGTAWHWVDPVAGPAQAARVLRPEGRLALFWHVPDMPPEASAAFAAVYRKFMPDSPVSLVADRPAIEIYQTIFDKVGGGIQEAGGFTTPEQWRFDWRHTYTRDEWLDQIPTHGALTQAPPDTLAAVLDGIGAAIDAMGGNLEIGYTTVVVTAARAYP